MTTTPSTRSSGAAPGSPGTASPAPATVGDLRASTYRYRTVKQELRENALRALASGRIVFPGLVGYQESVIPQILQSILSGHDLLLLGLRGQAKTRILRAFIDLLDDWIPVIAADGVDIPDDPIHPTTSVGKRAIAIHGDDTPIRWVHKSHRFHEKLATPDVTIADLIGELDLIKHAEGRYLSDEATMHFGLVPRSNRGLFVINELPDLAPRIQVGLFNVLEERDVQIRGYPIRLELDMCLMFSANPEDYTNRGRIVTPLKDRIGSVVRTHYPADNREAMAITAANAFVDRAAGIGRTRRVAESLAESPGASPAGIAPFGSTPAAPKAPEVIVPRVMHEIIEETIRQARRSPHINQASGVSVRASIAALEVAISAAELRGVRTKEARVTVRPCDLVHIAAALRGKIELMLSEDSPDGASTEDRLIMALVGEATKAILARSVQIDAVAHLAEPFATGMKLGLDDATSSEAAVASMKHVPGLVDAATALGRSLEMDTVDAGALACAGELVLEFLYVNHRLSKVLTRSGIAFTR